MSPYLFDQLTRDPLNDESLPDFVQGFAAYYAISRGYFTPSGLTRMAGNRDKVEDLRATIGDQIGVELTEIDIILSLHNLVPEARSRI